MKSTVIKRSIVIAQRKTSVSLEEEFWKALKDIARAHYMPLSALVLAIRRCHRGNLSSAIRVFVFQHYHAQVPAASAERSRPFAMIPALANHEAQAL